jgi:hypothetical protein
MEAFGKQFHPKSKLLIGPQGISPTDFLSQPPTYWLS